MELGGELQDHKDDKEWSEGHLHPNHWRSLSQIKRSASDSDSLHFVDAPRSSLGGLPFMNGSAEVTSHTASYCRG